MKPELVWLNGACFRKNPVSDRSRFFGGGEARPGGGDTADAYDDASCHLDLDQEYSEVQHEVEELDNGRFSVKMRVASAFYPIIIGKKGASKKRIEHETRTKVIIPRQGVEDEAVVISGGSRGDVLSACSRIELIVESSRSKMGFTHFISVPLNTAQMQQSFRDFKEQALDATSTESYSVRKIDESVFQTPTLLHLTVGVLALMDDYEREKAKTLLQECKESVIRPILGTEPLQIKIQGLEIMNDDPAEVDVIYAKIQSEDVSGNNDDDALQKISDGLVQKFVAAGLMAKQYDRVKLHMTVLNSKFRNRMEDEFEGYKMGAKRDKMDARSVMAQFAQHDFGQVRVNEIHLSQRRNGKRSQENYYFPSLVMPLL